MRGLIATLLMIVLGTPAWSGVGDVYYCTAYKSVNSFFYDEQGRVEVENTEPIFPKLTFKWTEEGMLIPRDGNEPSLYKFKQPRNRATPFFVTLYDCSYNICGLAFNQDILQHFQINSFLTQSTFLKCDKF
jgi:hypothetical protein